MKVGDISGVLETFNNMCEAFPRQFRYFLSAGDMLACQYKRTYMHYIYKIDFIPQYRTIKFVIYNEITTALNGYFSIEDERVRLYTLYNNSLSSADRDLWDTTERYLLSIFNTHKNAFISDIILDTSMFHYNYTDTEIKNALAENFSEYTKFIKENPKDKEFIRTSGYSLETRLLYDKKEGFFQLELLHNRERYTAQMYKYTYYPKLRGNVLESGTKPLGFDDGVQPYILLFSLMI